MKKQSRAIKSNKPTKHQPKNKAKAVTSPSVLTPRPLSPCSRKQSANWVDRVAEEGNFPRHNSPNLRPPDTHRKTDIRVTTDQQKPRKKFEEDETGTHTPLIKRLSLTSQTGKKKSYQSIVSTEQHRKKAKAKIISANSGELSQSTIQRLISVIIKDYREGKLKEKELQQTLLQLFDRKLGKVFKKSRKKDSFCGFSNDFLKSTRQTRSEALVRRRKKSEQIQERVIERHGFVNKIIIKGITTSLFLKEEANLSNMKEKEERAYHNAEIAGHIYTSSSVKDIAEDIKEITDRYNSVPSHKQITKSLEDMMATRIQRAWRRYKTKKILEKIKFMSQPVLGNQMDHFTDEEQEPGSPSDFVRNQVQPQAAQADQLAELVRVITDSMHSKVTKEECIRSIMKCLRVPQELVAVPEVVEAHKQEELVGYNFKEQHGKSEGEQQGSFIKVSRVCMLEEEEPSPQVMQEMPSNDLNSFTNKYSSKQVQEEVPLQQSELDQSLTFAKPQILNHESFKMVNIQSIQEGLRAREQALQMKKIKEVEIITQQYFNNHINKEVYLFEKSKIDKWFASQLKEIKSIKKSLLKSCSEAQSVLENGVTTLNTDKSMKMLKCLSDKYVKREWNIHVATSKLVVKTQAKSEQEQQQNLNNAVLDQKDNDFLVERQDEEDCIYFEQSDNLELKMQKHTTLSPKLPRHRSEEEEHDNQPISHYKYEELNKIIDQEEEALQDSLPQLENKRIVSERFPESNAVDNHEEQDHEISLIHNLLNETSKKFRYLCNEDKQDIFEFLFLDMVLEPFTQAYSGQARILKGAQGYINRAKRLKKIPKGIKTNLPTVKDYLKVLSEYVMKDRGNLRNLSLPMGPSAPQMLKYMRDQIVEMQQQNVSTTLVLPLDIFQAVSKLPQIQIKPEKYYDDQQREQSRVSFLKTAQHIHHKAIFDCVNEMLDHERPYGVWGKPFPWKKSLSVQRRWSAEKETLKITKAVDKAIESCSYLCGILVDKEDSLFGSHRVTNEYIFQIREDRLSKMLANELVQNEERWIFYDDEETQILMEVTSFVTKRLIKDLVLEIASFGLKF